MRMYDVDAQLQAQYARRRTYTPISIAAYRTRRHNVLADIRRKMERLMVATMGQPKKQYAGHTAVAINGLRHEIAQMQNVLVVLRRQLAASH